MRPHPALERTNKVWRELFGDGQHPVVGESDRLLVAAVVASQELRDCPELGLSQAEEPERMAVGWAYARMRREMERRERR